MPLVTAAVLLAAGLIALGAIGVMRSQATDTTPIGLVAIDANTSGNTATSIGTVDECFQISSSAGATHDIDVIVDSIPAFSAGPPLHNGIDGFQFGLLYDNTVFNVTAADNLQLIAANGEAGFDFSDTVPDSDGDYLATFADFGDADPEDGAGILTKFTLEVQPGAAVGLSDLTITGLGIGDANNEEYTITTIQNAQLSLGQPCASTPTPSPTPTPTPTPTPSPTPSPTPTASPTATAAQSPTASPAASASATPTPSPSLSAPPTPLGATVTPSAPPEPTGTATPTATQTPTPTEPLTVKGDANCSSGVDAYDALTVLLNAATGTPIPCPSAADVNCDGVADLADVLVVLSWLGDLTVTLPAGCPAIATTQ